jgi:hypothetical protein
MPANDVIIHLDAFTRLCGTRLRFLQCSAEAIDIEKTTAWREIAPQIRLSKGANPYASD